MNEEIINEFIRKSTGKLINYTPSQRSSYLEGMNDMVEFSKRITDNQNIFEIMNEEQFNEFMNEQLYD